MCGIIQNKAKQETTGLCSTRSPVQWPSFHVCFVLQIHHGESHHLSRFHICSLTVRKQTKWVVESPLLALPCPSRTIQDHLESALLSRDSTSNSFSILFIYLFFASLKLFCFPKAMHTPVSQEAGSKLPGLPFRVLAVVNNASLCHPSHERPEPRSGRHQPGGLFRLFQQRLFDHPHLKLSKFILNAPLL